jgi:small subunit ribosomal protein S17
MRDIGVDVKAPEKSCSDKNCPFHGHLKVRGQIIEGIVVSDGMQNSVVVQKDYLRYIKKYERYEKRRSRILAHNPPCISAKRGDRVKIMECRPISKAKSFVVIEKEAE